MNDEEKNDDRLSRIQAIAEKITESPAASPVWTEEVGNLTLRVSSAGRSWAMQSRLDEGCSEEDLVKLRTMITKGLIRSMATKADLCPFCLAGIPRVKETKHYRCKQCLYDWVE